MSPSNCAKQQVVFILIKIIGMLKAEDIKLNKNHLWDTLEIDWKEGRSHSDFQWQQDRFT